MAPTSSKSHIIGLRLDSEPTTTNSQVATAAG